MRPIQTRIALATGLLPALPAAHANDAAALAKELSNPVAALISVPLQSNWEQNIGPDDRGSRYTLNLQPVIPMSIGQDWNLVSRTIPPIIDQWGHSSGHGRSGRSFGHGTEPVLLPEGPERWRIHLGRRSGVSAANRYR